MIKEIPYGMGMMRLEGVPLDRFDVIRGTRYVSERPEREVFEDALEQPVAGVPLRDRVGSEMRVAVIIPDRTRVCGSERFLPWLLNLLTNEGLTAKYVKIVIGVGTHTGHAEKDLRRLVGDQVWGKWQVVVPDCQDTTSVVKVGVTPAGTEVLLNRHVAEADLVEDS